MNPRDIPERDVVHDVVQAAQLCGATVWRNAKGGRGKLRRGLLAPGSSDWIGHTKDGRFLAIEIKRPKGGVLSEDQHMFIGQVNMSGGVAFHARCAEDVFDVLRKEKRA